MNLAGLRSLAGRMLMRALRLPMWQVVVGLVLLAVAVSMLIVSAIDLLWDGRLSAELLVAGVITPLLDGILIVGLMVVMLSRLREEAARRERAEEVLKQAQHIGRIGSWSYDYATHAVQWSDEMYRIFELDPALGPSRERLLQQVHPDDRGEVSAAVERSLSAFQPFALSHRLLFPDGRVRHVHGRCEVLRARDDTPLRVVGTVQDISDRVALEQELRRLATTDALTGIANRHHFNELLRQELDRSKRYGSALSLIMFDIDRFKAVNDTHGHEMGDRVLVHLVDVTRGALRRSDVLARWGGEEFMILAPHTEMNDARQLAERLRAVVERTPLEGIPLTISLGVTTRVHQINADDLLRCADEALYRAKAGGRNQVQLSSC